jgi:hypothetical protein
MGYPRIYALLARNAPVGVIFRRGPSKQVLLIKWNLEKDTFEIGQWFKGRIYEHRCDLSPDGNLLLYFAANQKKPYVSWTAISRPPYLTALALWPKGDCWGGGGQFQTGEKLLLNHFAWQMELAQDFSVPKWLSVAPLGSYSGGGEDEPVWPYRLQLDGWRLIAFPEKSKNNHGATVRVEFDPPITWIKPNPVWPDRYSLELRIAGLGERNGPWTLMEHAFLAEGEEVQNIGRSDWADWASNGDLLFAQSGSLYHLRARRGKLGAIEESEEIADFTGLKFENKAPSQEALEWPRRGKRAKQKANMRTLKTSAR